MSMCGVGFGLEVTLRVVVGVLLWVKCVFIRVGLGCLSAVYPMHF